MNNYSFRIDITVSGEITEDEVRDYIGFESGAITSIYHNNPLLDEKSNAEIVSIDIS